MKEKEILLSYFPKITNKRYQQLLAAFSSLDRAWNAEFDNLKELGWDSELVNEFLSWRDGLNHEKISEELEKEKINCVTINSPTYPDLLKEVYDPPFCLFVRGDLPKDGFNLAVVGSRKFTVYGRQVTEELVSELARQGIRIISGLALGIDSIAHESALRANGTTVAVLGSGVDKFSIYPRSHIWLAEKIIESGGAVISEYPPRTEPTKYSFPMRNRIIAGMSLGTLVIEAGENSGALITAQSSIDCNREVFAVPQNINSHTAVGTNNLIKMGAQLTTSAKDILEALNLQDIKQYVANAEVIPSSPTEAKILEYLSKEPVHVDFLIKQSGLASHTVNGALALMEMKGKIRNLGGMMYVISR